MNVVRFPGKSIRALPTSDLLPHPARSPRLSAGVAAEHIVYMAMRQADPAAALARVDALILRKCLRYLRNRLTYSLGSRASHQMIGLLLADRGDVNEALEPLIDIHRRQAIAGRQHRNDLRRRIKILRSAIAEKSNPTPAA